MKISKRTTALLGGGLIVLALGALAAYQYLTVDQEPQGRGAATDMGGRWNWENPETLQEIRLPSAWRKFDGVVYKGALLTLSHDSGQSLVYLVNDRGSGNRLLEEYVAELEAPLGKQLGFDSFDDPAGTQGYVEARGAEVFGKTVAHTRVRIWAPEQGDFWQAVSITDQDYPELEYEADRVMDRLMETTR